MSPTEAARERLRLFVALELPEEIRGRLVEWGRVVGGERDGLAPVPRGSLHVTLCFLGMRDPDELSSIAAACQVVAGARVDRLALADGCWLPPRRPRVLAVSIRDPTGSLAGVQAQLSAALIAAGAYAPERRPYLPHVTVCRVRGQAGVRAAAIDPPPCLEFAPERITLLRSHLGRGPARYEPLAAVPLIAA